LFDAAIALKLPIGLGVFLAALPHEAKGKGVI